MPAPRPRRTGPFLAVGAVVATAALGLACSNEPERSVANYCSQAASIATLDADLASGDPVKIQARSTDLRLLQSVSPPDIEPSVVVLLGVTDDFARTAGTATDRAEVADEVFRGRSADLPAIEAAGNQVVAYTAANCEIDLDGGGTTTPTVPGSGTPTTSVADPGPTTTRPTDGAPTSTTTSTPSLLVD